MLGNVVEGEIISVGTLLFITTDGMVVSMSVMDGEISSLLGNIVEGVNITVRTLLFDGIVTLSVSVLISVMLREISSVELKLGVGILLGNIVEGTIISVAMLLSMDGIIVKLSVSISVTEGVITSVVGLLVRLGSTIDGEVIMVGMLLFIITVKLSVSISVMVGEISSVGLIKVGVKIRLGNIVEGEVITVATSLVFITSLINVIGISMEVVTSGCIVVKTSSLMLTDGSMEALEMLETVLGVIMFVTSGDGEKEGTTLVIFIITLVTEGTVKLNVSINENVVGEITSPVMTLVGVSTDVGVTGTVTIVLVVSSTLITSLLVTLNIVMTLEISNDGTVVKAMVSVIETLVSITIDGVSTVTNTDEKLVTKDVLVGI